jgi:parafibromin
MKKGTSIDPINLLRDYAINKKNIKISEKSLYFGDTKIPIKTATAWNPKESQKQYCIGDLWIFIDSHLNPNKYPDRKYYEEVQSHDLQIISRIDQDEIIKYFTGKIEDSEAINQELKASFKIGKKAKPDKDTDRLRDPLVTKKLKTEEYDPSKALDGTDKPEMNELAQREKDSKIIDYIMKLERPIDSKNRCLRKMNKSFKSVLNYLVQDNRVETDRPGGSGAPEKKGPTTLLQKVTQSSSIKESRPIIIVLSNQSNGNLWIGNARSFLEDGIYKEIDTTAASSLTEKARFSIRKDIRGKNITFDVTSDINYVKQEEAWGRVVAVFVNATTSQFHGWPDGDRLPILFSKMRAFYMKYHDVPNPDNIQRWNVKVLQVNRTQRFTDVNARNQFWEELEGFLIRPIHLN